MKLTYSKERKKTLIHLPGSKSITNRLLVLKTIHYPNLTILNSSTSTDSVHLQRAIKSLESLNVNAKIDAADGGTTFRFLSILLAHKGFVGNLYGSERLLARPNKPLIDSLSAIGYPISLNSLGEVVFHKSPNKVNLNHWQVDISISSQFASALSMLAPSMQNDITIELVGDPVSLGYLDMTIELMRVLGMEIYRKDNLIYSKPFSPSQDLQTITVESDWSSISYFIAISVLAGLTIELQPVSNYSSQPDIAILDFANQLGVDTSFGGDVLTLTPKSRFSMPKSIARDYTNCPDIALTEIVVCHALGIDLTLQGVEHLKHKESDRLKTISQELSSFDKHNLPLFNTHNDHRIAMSLAPLAVLKPISFNDIEVVSKSFPDFWKEIDKLGFHITPEHES